MTKREQAAWKRLLKEALALKRRAAAGLARSKKDLEQTLARSERWRRQDDARKKARRHGKRTVRARAAAKSSRDR